MLTVTSAASSYDLTTVARFKTQLGISSSSDDTLLAMLVAEASKAVSSYCDRVFSKETVTEVLRVREAGVPSLALERWPVVSITSVTEGDTILTTDDYELNAAAGTLLRLNAGQVDGEWRPGKITIVYVCGYVTEAQTGTPKTLPEDIESACLDMVRALWFGRKRDSSVKSESVPDVASVTYNVAAPGETSSLPDSVKAKLGPYKRKV